MSCILSEFFLMSKGHSTARSLMAFHEKNVNSKITPRTSLTHRYVIITVDAITCYITCNGICLYNFLQPSAISNILNCNMCAYLNNLRLFNAARDHRFPLQKLFSIISRIYCSHPRQFRFITSVFD
jgi:hypothetical protein